MSAGPPSLLRRILERALPEELREGIVGDLEELYRARRGRSGAAAAGAWYAGQVAAISLPFGADRLRELVPFARTSLGPDLRLGVRMLVKYPMLTVVAGIAITVATALGVGGSEFVRDLVAPSLPFEGGDRIVRVYQVDSEAGRQLPPTLLDLERWRESVPALEELGGYVTLEQGLVGDRGEVGAVNLAQVSASAFRVTGVPPLMGRTLQESDEAPGAPPVVVLGHSTWQTVMAGDPGVLGRTVQLGGTPATVVGVMPEGYAFPNVQNAWAPLRVESAELQPGSAPRAMVFGRLAPGATLESAAAELERAGALAAADHPDAYRNLSPAVTEFARRGTDGQMALMLAAVRLLFIFLLVVACANVATLVFARTVMREGEIAVRSALGASRRRIVLQLFAEALVLVGGATLLGVVLAGWGLDRVARLFFMVQQAPGLPFWWNPALSPATLAYAVALALVGAVMIGVVPALKATGGALQPRLGTLTSGGPAGGGSGLRFGGMWTVIIVLQVALSVAFLPLAVSMAGTAFRDRETADFPAREYLTAQLGRDAAVAPRTEEEEEAFRAEAYRLFQEARDRVASDPAVQGAALASGLSAMNHILSPVEFVGDGVAFRDAPAAAGETPGPAGPATSGAGEAAAPTPGPEAPTTGYVRILLVDPGYLELMGATAVAGRTLASADFAPGGRSVVVNQAFVDQVLGGRNALGGQLRFPERRGESSIVSVPEAGSSVDVVGVVQDPGIDRFGPGTHPVIYAPLELAPVSPRAVGLVGMPQAPAVQLFARMRPGADPLPARLYGIVASVDPGLRLSAVGTAEDAWRPAHQGERLGAWIFMAVAGIVLMLSVAGIYALMSFTVSRRTREIAIRTAIGARRGQIVGTVFRRAFLQLLVGVALGGIVAVPVLRDGVADDGPRTLVLVSVLLVGAGLAACLVPVRRALAIQPAAAMKAE